MVGCESKNKHKRHVFKKNYAQIGVHAQILLTILNTNIRHHWENYMSI